VKRVDFLIIGQGLAGSMLAMELMRSGAIVHVIDDRPVSNSSRVAAGLFNPITGRKMVKTWLADEIFPLIGPFYSGLEKTLGVQIYYPRPMYRPFFSIAEQNDWTGKMADPAYSHYVSGIHQSSLGLDEVEDPFGGLMLNYTGFVDLPTLLDAVHFHLVGLGSYSHELFDVEKLDAENKEYPGFAYDRLIFCEGTEAAKNHFWELLKFNLVKGEVLFCENLRSPGMGYPSFLKADYMRPGCVNPLKRW